MYENKIGPYGRSVSIIGVGCTPFMKTLENEETKGLTENELYAYAAKEAMEDAGINPREVQFYYHGEVCTGAGSDYITPAMQVADWFGMRGRPSLHHNEACCTGYAGFEAGVLAVASGKYDFVLTGGVEMTASVPVPDKPACFRQEKPAATWMHECTMPVDRAYGRPMLAPLFNSTDEWSVKYAMENGLTFDQMDDVFRAMVENCRYASVKNPRAYRNWSLEEEAKKAGFDSVDEYWKSPLNPRFGEILRFAGTEADVEGAACVLLCPTELAYKFNHKPIEVLGTGHCCLLKGTPDLEERATIEAVREVYELTGLSGDDLDLLETQDFLVYAQLMSAELTGYLPKGEGWKYVLDGRTRYDGDKPINTHGGRTALGHALGASGLADFYEAAKQMWGECGERQVNKLPKTSMVRGFGGGQNVTATILRTVD